MLLRNPQPDPEFTHRFGVPTELEIPAMPKQQAWTPPKQQQEWRPKRPTMEFPAIPKQQEWTPPRYWKELLQVQETKFERICKSWFVKIVTVLAILYILALITVFLGKLFMMVVALK